MEEKTICIRCHLPFVAESWDDEICDECNGEMSVLRYEEQMMEDSD